MKILIDGDIIAHRIAARVQDRVDIPEMRSQIEDMVDDWASCGTEDDDIIICLSEGKSFRYWVWPEYKANRKKREDPPMLVTAFDILKHDYYTWTVSGLEGDDCLGIIQTDDTENSIIVTIDKDLMQVPGWHFNPDKDKTKHYITHLMGSWYYHIQWLMGDSSDNLPGLPRVGIKTAVKILGDIHDMDEMTDKVVNEYKERGQSDTYCHQMERCVRILTRKDYDKMPDM